MALNREDISKGTDLGVEKYNGLDFLSRVAMFIGRAQILEFGLKRHLQDNFGYEWEDMEKWTLGQTKVKLEKEGVRKDFLHYLKSVVDHRNYIAHEIIVNRMLWLDLSGSDVNHYDKEQRNLDKGIVELEQILFLFDWTNKNKGW